MNLKGLMTGATASLVMLFAATATAQDGECASDGDCPEGFACQEVQFGYCNDCAEPAPGEDLPESCGCFEETRSYCEPPPPTACSDDADCAESEICVTYTFESCSGGGRDVPACPPGDECDVDPPEEIEPECETKSEAYCVPPYLAPCDADTDCGPGFTCENVEVCGCSGGAPEPDPVEPGSDDEAAPDESCSCEPLDEKYCELVEVSCETDADCDDGLTCQDFGYDRPDTTCSSDEECPPVEPEAERFCAPEGYGARGGAWVEDDGASLAESTGNGDARVTGAERGEFFPVDGDDDGGADAKSDPRGCSTTGSSPDVTLALLILAGMLLRRQRRRETA